jgi:uncharacterized protein (TIGR02594 family)
MTKELQNLQRAAVGLGYDPGPIDGLWGPRTEGAILAIVKADGRTAIAASGSRNETLPWMKLSWEMVGLHEIRDHTKLSKFLKSDGSTLGDPAKLPWCGDAVETITKNTLPDEPFPGPLETNPYWARNWVFFGREVEPTYGAYVIFSRGTGGHVGNLVGEDNSNFYVLGGNQSDSWCVVPIAKSRMIGCRWPKTWPLPSPIPKLPRMSKGGVAVSTNEA